MNIMEEELTIGELIKLGIFDRDEFHKVSNEIWEILESRCKCENRSAYITNIINVLANNFGMLFAHFKMDENESKKYSIQFVLLIKKIHEELYEQIRNSKLN